MYLLLTHFCIIFKRTCVSTFNAHLPSELTQLTHQLCQFLTLHNSKEGSLSALVRKAVSLHILSSLTAEAKKKVRAAGLSQQELDKTIAQAIAWTKKQERGRMPVPRTNPQAKRR